MRYQAVLGGFLLSSVLSCVEAEKNDSSGNAAAQPKAREKIELAKPENNLPNVPYVTIRLKQSHFSLSLWEHAKDEMNAAEFPLPVSYDTYQKLSKDTQLVDEFRSGSFFMKGSLGDWNMTVQDKPTLADSVETEAGHLKLELSQSHFSLSLSDHLADAMNKVDIELDVPKSVYNKVDKGHDFIEDGFRMGSLLMKGSAGEWHLKVKEKTGLVPPSSQARPLAP